MFKDSHAFYKTCENCQKLGSISKRHMMPLNPIFVIEIFDCWGIDFMGPFPPSFGFFFFIKCKNCIDKKLARQACGTSWKPAVYIDIHIQAKGTDSLEQTTARQARGTGSKGNKLPCTT